MPGSFSVLSALGAEWNEQKSFEGFRKSSECLFLPSFFWFFHISTKKSASTILPSLNTLGGTPFPWDWVLTFQHAFSTWGFLLLQPNSPTQFICIHHLLSLSAKCPFLSIYLGSSQFSTFQVKFKYIFHETLPDLSIFQTSSNHR